MQHVTETIADTIDEAPQKLQEKRGKPNKLPGPSTNPATNLLIADIAMRGVGRIVRHSLQKGVLRTRYDRDKARDIVDNRSIVSALAIYGVTKLATRSVPGALLVGGGLLAKTLYDRSKSRVVSRRKGEKVIDRIAEDK